MQRGHLWRFINNAAPFSLTNEGAQEARRVNKTPARVVWAKPQQGKRVAWNYHTAEVMRSETEWKIWELSRSDEKKKKKVAGLNARVKSSCLEDPSLRRESVFESAPRCALARWDVQ